MTDKLFSVTVCALGTPLAIGSLIACFFNPAHIFTAAVLIGMVCAALFERDTDGENLYTALKRVFRGQ